MAKKKLNKSAVTDGIITKKISALDLGIKRVTEIYNTNATEQTICEI